MSQLEKKLTKKISPADIFVVMATKNYLDALRNMDGDILTQIDIARKFQKPFLIVVDKRLSKNEIKEIDEYLSNDNIIKRVAIDIYDHISKRNVASEIKRLAREVSGKDEDIHIITPYSNDEEEKL